MMRCGVARVWQFCGDAGYVVGHKGPKNRPSVQVSCVRNCARKRHPTIPNTAWRRWRKSANRGAAAIRDSVMLVISSNTATRLFGHGMLPFHASLDLWINSPKTSGAVMFYVNNVLRF
jgi:hypothetical protein